MRQPKQKPITKRPEPPKGQQLFEFKLSEEQIKALTDYIIKCLTTGFTGSYRYLIYNVLKFDTGDYSTGMDLGLLNLNNVIFETVEKLFNRKDKGNEKVH